MIGPTTSPWGVKTEENKLVKVEDFVCQVARSHSGTSRLRVQVPVAYYYGIVYFFFIFYFYFWSVAYLYAICNPGA